MSEFKKSLVLRLHAAIDAALNNVAKEHGISLKTTPHTFYPESGSFTLKLKGVLSGGVDKRGALYNSLRKMRPKLPALKSTFVHDGETHKIVGANTTGTKVITKCGDKEFEVRVDAVERICGK